MKNFLLLCITVLISFSLHSQNEAYKKYADVKGIELPYTDNVNFKSDKDILITEADWLNFGFSALEVFDPDFQYSVYGTAGINEHKVLLIKRIYREESNHWAVFINDDGRILSYINIAYNNSEGSLYIESEITAGMITVKESNHMGETPQETEKHYILTETGFEEN